MKIIFWARYSKYNFNSFNHRTTMKLEFLRGYNRQKTVEIFVANDVCLLGVLFYKTVLHHARFHTTKRWNWRGLKMRRPVKSFWRNWNFDNPCFLMSSTKQLSKRGFVLKWVNVVFVWTRYLKILALCLGRSSTVHSLY